MSNRLRRFVRAARNALHPRVQFSVIVREWRVRGTDKPRFRLMDAVNGVKPPTWAGTRLDTHLRSTSAVPSTLCGSFAIHWQSRTDILEQVTCVACLRLVDAAKPNGGEE